MQCIKCAFVLPAIFCALIGEMPFALANAAGPDVFEARASQVISAFTNRPLPPGPATQWVDAERWSVAHACLEANVRLDEANRYFTEVTYVSTRRGLVADTDVQITDLLWTWFRFQNSPHLTPAARDHMMALFRDWQVPNPDRNRQADREYEWPCEYTENHSLNILVAAYLIDSLCALDRSLRRDLLLRFLQDRARWGWNEFHSPAYAIVTAKALCLLAAVAPDSEVAGVARMHLDLMAFDFASTGLRFWRGMPHARGYGSEISNAGNSFCNVIRLWFGDQEPVDMRGADPFLLHMATGPYRPPATAVRWLRDISARGSHEVRKTVTHGPGKQRIPIVAWVTPVVTMASAQGAGSYYDGSYCSISFASSPLAVIVARDGKQYNILQCRNVLATFGSVTWHGPLIRETEGNLTIGGDAGAWVGQLDLAPDCHVLMVGEKVVCPERAAFCQAMAALNARLEDGVVTWTMKDGTEVRMVNERAGGHWRVRESWKDGERWELDSNMLFDASGIRSVRDSAVIEVIDGANGAIYDFRDVRNPVMRKMNPVALTPILPGLKKGPLDMVFRYVPAGEFPMGSSLTEGRANERPSRWISVDGFYISETEVTVEQYRAYMAENPGAAPLPDWYWAEWGRTGAYPMTMVNWDEANAFCKWLSGQGHGMVRLPTEAEWEKAAKGYQQRVYPWGNAYDGTQSGTKNGVYAPAGEHPLDVSPFGVRGMAGNAWEWCADWYASDGYAVMPYMNPVGPRIGSERVLRGCGWNFDPDTFRCAFRSKMTPETRSVHIGFRVVWVP